MRSVPLLRIIEAALLNSATKIVRADGVGPTQQRVLRIRESHHSILVRYARVPERERVRGKLPARSPRVRVPLVRLVIQDYEVAARAHIIEQARVSADQ